MTLAASYWSPRAILEALGPVIAAECARPIVDGEPGGGTGFPVDIAYADEESGRLKNQSRGRIVLMPGSGVVGPPGELARDAVVMRWRPTGRAEIWAPADRVSGLARTDAAWRLAHCVLAALSARHIGWPSGAEVPGAELTLEPDPRVFRNGQAAVILFPYSVPVFEGRPIEVLGDGSSIGTVGDVPGGGPGGGGLDINPA